MVKRDGWQIDMIFVLLFDLQIRGWKQWELETLSHDYEFSNGMFTIYDTETSGLLYRVEVRYADILTQILPSGGNIHLVYVYCI